MIVLSTQTADVCRYKGLARVTLQTADVYSTRGTRTAYTVSENKVRMDCARGPLPLLLLLPLWLLLATLLIRVWLCTSSKTYVYRQSPTYAD